MEYKVVPFIPSVDPAKEISVQVPEHLGNMITIIQIRVGSMSDLKA